MDRNECYEFAGSSITKICLIEFWLYYCNMSIESSVFFLCFAKDSGLCAVRTIRQFEYF